MHRDPGDVLVTEFDLSDVARQLLRAPTRFTGSPMATVRPKSARPTKFGR